MNKVRIKKWLLVRIKMKMINKKNGWSNWSILLKNTRKKESHQETEISLMTVIYIKLLQFLKNHYMSTWFKNQIFHLKMPESEFKYQENWKATWSESQCKIQIKYLATWIVLSEWFDLCKSSLFWPGDLLAHFRWIPPWDH